MMYLCRCTPDMPPRDLPDHDKPQISREESAAAADKLLRKQTFLK